MYYYKSIIGNQKISACKFLFFCLFLLLGQKSLKAQECTQFMTPELARETLTEVLVNSSSGEVICFKKGIYEGLRIENIQGGDHGITLQAVPGEQVEIQKTLYKGSGIYMVNSSHISLSGFIISGGLYGIYVKGSTDVAITFNQISDVGQEAIVVKSGQSAQSLSNFVISHNIIADTGKGLSQYGEGIYVGDGNDNFNEVLTNITIAENVISATTNEAIDIKINVKNVDVYANKISDVNLKFNGAITFATSDRLADDGNVKIRNNIINGVTNRLGYIAIGIAVGQGNVLIEGNHISEEGTKFTGICLYSTFMNTLANTVYLGENEILTEGKTLSVNCGSGGSGANALAHVIDLAAQ